MVWEPNQRGVLKSSVKLAMANFRAYSKTTTVRAEPVEAPFNKLRVNGFGIGSKCRTGDSNRNKTGPALSRLAWPCQLGHFCGGSQRSFCTDTAGKLASIRYTGAAQIPRYFLWRATVSNLRTFVALTQNRRGGLRTSLWKLILKRRSLRNKLFATSPPFGVFWMLRPK